MMKLTKRLAGSMLGMGLLVGVPLSGFVLAQQAQQSPPPSVATDATDVNEQGEQDQQKPSLNGSIQVPEAANEQNEQDEAAALQGLATISADEAQTAALATNAGATATKVELGDENGSLVYDVQLSTGVEVKVDAGNGAILHTEQEDANEVDEANEGGENEANEMNEQSEHGEAPATQEAHGK